MLNVSLRDIWCCDSLRKRVISMVRVTRRGVANRDAISMVVCKHFSFVSVRVEVVETEGGIFGWVIRVDDPSLWYRDPKVPESVLLYIVGKTTVNPASSSLSLAINIYIYIVSYRWAYESRSNIVPTAYDMSGRAFCVLIIFRGYPAAL